MEIVALSEEGVGSQTAKIGPNIRQKIKSRCYIFVEVYTNFEIQVLI